MAHQLLALAIIISATSAQDFSNELESAVYSASPDYTSFFLDYINTTEYYFLIPFYFDDGFVNESETVGEHSNGLVLGVLQDDYVNYVYEYNKTEAYNTSNHSEIRKRFALYIGATCWIDYYSQSESNSTYGITQFVDMFTWEVDDLLTDTSPTDLPNITEPSTDALSSSTESSTICQYWLPPKDGDIDSTKDLFCTRPPDQRVCGSCWVMAATGQFQDNLDNHNGGATDCHDKPEQYALQYPMDCSGEGSCDGGSTFRMLEWYVENGACYIDNYKFRYRSKYRPDNCKPCTGSGTQSATGCAVVKVEPDSKTAVAYAASKYSMAFATNVPKDFKHLTGGWDCTNGVRMKGHITIRHAMVLEFMVTPSGNKRFRLRGSWGTKWMKGGYINATWENLWTCGVKYVMFNYFGGETPSKLYGGAMEDIPAFDIHLIDEETGNQGNQGIQSALLDLKFVALLLILYFLC